MSAMRKHGQPARRTHGSAVRVISGNYVAAKRRGVVGGVDYGETGEARAGAALRFAAASWVAVSRLWLVPSLSRFRSLPPLQPELCVHPLGRSHLFEPCPHHGVRAYPLQVRHVDIEGITQRIDAGDIVLLTNLVRFLRLDYHSSRVEQAPAAAEV